MEARNSDETPKPRNLLSNLAAAYVAAWGEIDNVVKNAKNPHLGNNYADLSAVLDTVRPVFHKHGLALMTYPGVMDGDSRMTMGWALFHTSGENINGSMSIPVSADKKGQITAQAAGSAITYMRRYLTAAVGGITQVDDDGNAASTPKGGKAKADPSDAADYMAKKAGYIARIKGCGTVAELDALKPELAEFGDQGVADEFAARKRELKTKKTEGGAQ